MRARPFLGGFHAGLRKGLGGEGWSGCLVGQGTRARDCEFTRRAGVMRGWVIVIDSRTRRLGGTALIPKWIGGVISGGGMG